MSVSKLKLRWLAHKALEQLETLDHCVKPRRPEYASRIEHAIEDIRKLLIRVIGATP